MAKATTPTAAKETNDELGRIQNELALIALILKVGGHDLHPEEIERAKTHRLVIEQVTDPNAPHSPSLTRVSAIPIED